MSSALAIAAVTASLKDLLNDGLIDHDLSQIGSFSVTALPPDRVSTGTTENNQLNLFLYQVSPNLGWRNVGLPSHDRSGQRIATPPLALDLHYLLTAYGAQDLNAEVLLGYAMQVLHDNPILTRGQLRVALAPVSPIDGSLLPGPFGMLSAADLADQVELVKVTPVYLGTDDLSKLWTAMQARFRPSMAYSVSVVLLQSALGANAPLPVLQRGRDDRGPIAQGQPAPVVQQARAWSQSPQWPQPAVRLGDDVLASGRSLGRAGLALRLQHLRLNEQHDLAPKVLDDTRLTAHIPTPAEDATAMDGWAIGVYRVVPHVTDTDPAVPAFDGEGALLALAPRIVASPLAQAAGTVSLSLTCTPRIRPDQEAQVRLLFNNAEWVAVSLTTPGDATQPTTLTFSVPGVPVGSYPVRLRVEGIESLVSVASGNPPRLGFDPAQTVTVS